MNNISQKTENYCHLIDMSSYDIIDFGESCGASLITSALNIKGKSLFGLGGYKFHQLSYFLNENKFEEIYDKKYLTLRDGTVPAFENYVNRYSYWNGIVNTKYGFIFLHDFGYDTRKKCITNYDFIVKKFDEKIASLRESFTNDKKLVFLTLVDNCKNVTEHNAISIVQSLKLHMPNPNKKFYLIIFSNSVIEIQCDHVVCIKLESPTHNTWFMPTEKKNKLLFEIFEKLSTTLSSLE